MGIFIRICGYFWILFMIAYYFWIEFWPAIVSVLVAYAFLILLCWSISHKKKAVMKIATTAMVFCFTVAITWCVLFPTAYPYVDLWVLGKTEEQIIEAYGEPEYNDGRGLAYKTKWVFADMDYYVIEFDKNDKACHVFEAPWTPVGG